MEAEMATAKSQGADVAELRIDHITFFDPRTDLELRIKNRPILVIVTYRPKWEGGQYEGNDNKRFEALLCAMELGAEYVDIELKVAGEFLDFISGQRPEGTKLIVSSHNYEFTPSSEDLSGLVAMIQAVGADIVKIATFAVDICDVASMLRVLVHCQEALSSYALVFDAIYNLNVTRLMHKAGECGATLVSGVVMFFWQAAEHFELFFNSSDTDRSV